MQLIYAHFPPAAILAAERHLRAQTRIEQRAHQFWLAAGGRPGNAWADWLRAEREVVQNLCAALRSGNLLQPQTSLTRLPPDESSYA